MARGKLLGLNVRTIGTAAIAVSAALLISGCGGSSDSSGSARLRAVNLSSDGGTGTIYVNSGSANGEQNFDQASTYLYIDGGISSFSYSLSNNDTIIPASVVRTLDDGSSYTIALVGRDDVDVGDTRLAQVILLDDDHTSVPSGSAFLRMMNTAPDTTTLNASVGGVSFTTNLSYPTATGYQAVPAGSSSLSYTIAGRTYNSPNINLSSGHTYSLFITEPVTVTTATPTPTYSSLLLDDDH